MSHGKYRIHQSNKYNQQHKVEQFCPSPNLEMSMPIDTNLRARLNYSKMQPTIQGGVAYAKENESIQ